MCNRAIKCSLNMNCHMQYSSEYYNYNDFIIIVSIVMIPFAASADQHLKGFRVSTDDSRERGLWEEYEERGKGYTGLSSK